LTGGSGNDIFVFNTPLSPSSSTNTNLDTITDFVTGDKIQISRTVFAAFASTGIGAISKDDFYIINTTTSQDSTDKLLYNKADGYLSYDPDGFGGNSPIKFVLLGTTNNHPDLQYSDIQIIA
jgi:Ca2+-binding RTX toxin-like protein